MFRKRPREKVADIEPLVWAMSAPKDKGAFFASLRQLLPPDSILVIEGARARDVRRRLRTLRLSDTSHIRRDTLWPFGSLYHLPIMPEVLWELAHLLENHALPEVLDHLKAYKDRRTLLTWHDVACDDPVFVSLAIDEQTLRRFAESLGCTYEQADFRR
jgi:hypothetical protein